jgi:hypothetical protein
VHFNKIEMEDPYQPECKPRVSICMNPPPEAIHSKTRKTSILINEGNYLKPRNSLKLPTTTGGSTMNTIHSPKQSNGLGKGSTQGFGGFSLQVKKAEGKNGMLGILSSGNTEERYEMTPKNFNMMPEPFQRGDTKKNKTQIIP